MKVATVSKYKPTSVDVLHFRLLCYSILYKFTFIII